MKIQKKIKKNFIYHIIDQDLSKNKNLKIHTRFPPEPNGHLHIGHAKSIFLNFSIAKFYKGKCNLRFDDTNPTKENVKFISSIKKDILWLGFVWNDDIKFSSQYFSLLYKFAVQLIKKNLAYVDQLTKKQIRDYRGTLKKPGKKSPYRSRSIKENLYLFKQMKKGLIPEGHACLRAKIDMESPFIIMRDPVLYRILYCKHHQTLNYWCIYPMYDFAHCIADTLENITHSLCTLEFQENKHLYNWILNNIDINVKNRPYQYEFSPLKLEYNVLSKRKLQMLVDKKIVNGWNDPRMPTISGLRKKGYTPDSIIKFCEKVGVTKQNNLIQLSTLESCIRKELNETSPRIMAILNPIKIIIENLPECYMEIINIPNHPNKPEMGNRKIIFSKEIYIDKFDFCEYPSKEYKRLSIGKTVKLRYGYNITATAIKKNQFNNIEYITCTYDPHTIKNNLYIKKYVGIIHWISIKNTISAKFKIYKKLFYIQNPELKKNFLDYINTNTLNIKTGFVEKSIMMNLSIRRYQFEREGYFYLCCSILKDNFLTFNQIVTLKKNKQKNILSTNHL
ncbi:glutamine--tRNA ligase [Buchnera aphidicola (Nipponaphis monzeni)]|uniref:Glutamine--tRNA ligase n=1 Tax=Buchnera aphidicola (Nipponaphis monzeni) TaxID=2495405 RepID=A0A455TAI5_9GAMM|nr:glutamine--tRNA ligase/YqeY domain fusion protein [Buchnera aphidicola]BBI01325.1 glutamine--tRNA ligase [Buchnera aphidicola (Nipponaphis monzeni)]